MKRVALVVWIVCALFVSAAFAADKGDARPAPFAIEVVDEQTGRGVPLVNAKVTGQDSTQAAVYRGKIHFFWGDTNRLAYPLGHFGTAAATAQLPGKGGLDPSAGVDLEYFVDDDGFSRPVFAKEDNNPIWLDGLMLLKDKQGVERLVGKASVQKSLTETVARRLVVFNDGKGGFDTLKEIPLDVPLYPQAHPLRA